MVKFHNERKKKPIIEAKFEEGNIVKRDGVVYIQWTQPCRSGFSQELKSFGVRFLVRRLCLGIVNTYLYKSF